MVQRVEEDAISSHMTNDAGAHPAFSQENDLLRIDSLAYVTGIPSRTIRFYNTQGLLPPPIMRGRTAYYHQEHMLVLNIIRELKEQYHMPLETIKQFLRIRAQHGDVQMNLALKRRAQRSFGGQQIRLTAREFAQQTGCSDEHIDELLSQGLLFPIEVDGGLLFNGDDLLLVQIYQGLDLLGLPLSLPALIRFQLRQLVRSEVAACEQHVLPRWQAEGLPLEQQTERFEEIMSLTDSLISTMHRRLLYTQD